MQKLYPIIRCKRERNLPNIHCEKPDFPFVNRFAQCYNLLIEWSIRETAMKLLFCKHKMLSAAFFFGFAAASVAFFRVGPARAQGPMGINVQPAIFEQKVAPGDMITSSFRAKNTGQAARTFYLSVRNIKGLGTLGDPIFAGESEPTGYELSSWISVSSDPLTIEPNGETEVPFSIKVPDNATPGGHYGSIFLTSRPQAPSQTGTGIGYEIAVVINLRSAGQATEEARIREFRTDKQVYANPDVNFFIKMENLGNVLVQPHGVIELSDFFGNKGDTVRINDPKAAVFPLSTREYQASWTGHWWTFGRRQATLSLAYGDESRNTVSATISFWVFPIKIMLAAAGAILLLILLFIAAVKITATRKLKQIYGNVATLSSGAGAQQDSATPAASPRPTSTLTTIVIAIMACVILFLLLLFFLLA
jgi:hypothetical protein